MREAERQLKEFIERAIKETQEPESLEDRIRKMHTRIKSDENKKVEKNKYGL